MLITINGVKIEVLEKQTNIPGLKFEPQMLYYNNFADGEVFTCPASVEVSKQNYDLTSRMIDDYMTDGIVEIGVSRNGEGSFTNAMLSKKPNSVPYLGIDINDKTYLDDPSKKIYTIKENSYSQDLIRKKLKEIGMEKISILFIDGLHSVDACINDWKYTDLLSDKALVLLHDTNHHPGPTILVEAIDKNKFDVQKFFENQDDNGMAVAIKK